MRLFLLSYICLIGLTGCVNYANMKAHTQPLSPADLAQPHSYKTPTQPITTCCWWKAFRDAQLNQLIDIALSESPTIQNAKARVHQAQQLTAETSSSLWPSIDASGYLQRERFSETGLVPPPFNGKVFNIASLGLNFNYEFDFWGKNRQALAARVSEQQARIAEYHQTQLILSTAVASAYLQLQNNRIQLNIASRRLKTQQEILKIIHYRTSHGVASDIPFSTAQAQMEAAQLAVTKFKEAADLSLHRLAVLIGKNPAETQIQTKQTQTPILPLPRYLPANLLAQRPDIQASKALMEASAHRINVAKARFFPNINLNSLFSYQSIFIGQLFKPSNENNAIAGAIDLPIFDAGARRANLGVRYAEYDMAVTTYNQTLLRALGDVSDQLSILTSLKTQLASQNSIIAANKQKYKLVSSQYQHGIVDYLQVLENNDVLLQQQASGITLLTYHSQAMVGMFKALGGTS